MGAGEEDDPLPVKRQGKEADDLRLAKRHKEEGDDGDDHHHQMEGLDLALAKRQEEQVGDHQVEGDSDSIVMREEEGSSPSGEKETTEDEDSEEEEGEEEPCPWLDDVTAANFLDFSGRNNSDYDRRPADAVRLSKAPTEHPSYLSWQDRTPHDYDYGYEDAMKAKENGEMDEVYQIDSLLSQFEPTDEDEGEHEATSMVHMLLIPCCWVEIRPPISVSRPKNYRTPPKDVLDYSWGDDPVLREYNNSSMADAILQEGDKIDKPGMVLRGDDNINKADVVLREDDNINKADVVLREDDNINKSDMVHISNQPDDIMQEVHTSSQPDDIVVEDHNKNRPDDILLKDHNRNQSDDVMLEDHSINKSDDVMLEDDESVLSDGPIPPSTPPSEEESESSFNKSLTRMMTLRNHLLEISLRRTEEMYKDMQEHSMLPKDLHVDFKKIASRLKKKAALVDLSRRGYFKLQDLLNKLEFSMWSPGDGPPYILLNLHRYKKTGRISRLNSYFNPTTKMCEKSDQQFVKLYDDLLDIVKKHEMFLLEKKGRSFIMGEMRKLGKERMEEGKLPFEVILRALMYAKRYGWSSHLATERFRIKRYIYQQYSKGEEYAHREPLLEKLRLVEKELILKWRIPIPRLLGDSETFSDNVRNNNLPEEARNEIFREYRLTLATIDSLHQVHYVEHIRRKLEVAGELGILNVSCGQLYNKLSEGTGSGSVAGGIEVHEKMTTEAI